MTRFSLLLKNLRYFRAANAAVIAGMAVATAVIAGAMMVGDSVKQSLRDLAQERLGPVDYALVSPRFFDQSLAQRLAAAGGFSGKFDKAVAGISLRGGAGNGKLRTGGVQIFALDNWANPPEGAAIANAELANAIDLKNGQPMTLYVPIISDTPREAALGQRGLNDIRTSLDLASVKIDRQPGFQTLFSLAASQRAPLNAWLNLSDLQDELAQGLHGDNQTRRINMILVHGSGSPADLNQALKSTMTLADYGLELKKDPLTGESILSSRTTYLSPPVLDAADAIAKELNIPANHVSVYLINHLTDQSQSNKALHYLMAAGMTSIAGQSLADGQIILNQWAADQLAAKPGDHLQLSYFQREPTGQFKEVQADQPYTVHSILPMQGIGADPSLTPTYKGLTDARSIATWQKPEGLDINTKLVTPADEDYWKQHKAAPKVFLPLATAKKLWGNVYGDVNSIRIPSDKADAFAKALLSHLDPAATGMAFTPVKQKQIAAAGEGTDFAGLFIGFSFFLIASAIILVAMLFRLGIEQRARQFGLLGAIGFGPGGLLRLSLTEGLILAVIGGVIGVALGVGYTALVMAGLRTWWKGAVGTSAMHLHVSPQTLATGLITGILVAMAAVLWGAWKIRRAQAATLLAGAWQQTQRISAKRRGSLILAAVGLILTLAMLGWAKTASAQEKQYAFLGAGSMLLVALLALTANRMGTKRLLPEQLGTGSLGVRNAGRHRGRSIMTIALLAFASFSLVVVAAFKETPPQDVHDKSSGTGGYSLILTSDVPLLGDLNTKKGRDLVGIRNSDDPLWTHAHFTQLRMWAGQDASCLNMTRPTSPTILGVPPSLLDGRFGASPKTLAALDGPIQGDQVPIIADKETAQYILHLDVGQSLPILDQVGKQRQLKLVATLDGSVFQSELLMSEQNFRRLFPDQDGYNVLLVDAPSDLLPQLRHNLAEELGDFSITIEGTDQRLARYQEVANTYLSTFRILGSLGLLLGTIGLAVILLRSLIERRAELSLLSAIGFAPGQKMRLVLSENIFLLVGGLLVGTASALVAILPAITTSHRRINIGELLATLAVILVFGLLVLLITLRWAGRGTAAQDLRHE